MFIALTPAASLARPCACCACTGSQRTGHSRLSHRPEVMSIHKAEIREKLARFI